MRGLFGLIVVTLVGCATEPPTEEEVLESGVSVEALSNGCHAVCPRCPPRQICPAIACLLQCPPGVTPCGDTVCRNGDVCCNASCGICTPPGGVCTQEICGSGI